MTTAKALSLVSFLIVAGCGGSSTSSGGSTSFTALSLLSTGQGVARGIDANGEQALIYTSEIAEFLAGANSTNDAALDVSISDLPVTSTVGNRVIRKGLITSGDTLFNVRAIEYTGASAVFIETPGFVDTTMVTGSAFSSPPSTGTYTYTGTQTIHSRTTVAPGSYGSFSMDVDFGADTFSYSGSSGSFTISGIGSVDNVNGRFSTNGLSVLHTAGYDYRGTMYGQLHGSGATATSGVFHSDNVDWSGAFVGSR